MFYATVIDSKGRNTANNGDIVWVESVKNENGFTFYRFKGKMGNICTWYDWRFKLITELTLNEYINKRGEMIEQRT